jgi:adenylate cyclase
MADLGYAYGVLGNKSDAQKILSDLNRMASRRYVSPMMMAEIHVGLGDKTEALAWLEKAHQDRSLGSFIPLNYPQWDPLRGDPRFQALQRRMNLPL